MKKKWTALLLLFALLASMLSGCGKKDWGPDEKPVELTPAGNVVSRYTKDDNSRQYPEYHDTRGISWEDAGTTP